MSVFMTILNRTIHAKFCEYYNIGIGSFGHRTHELSVWPVLNRAEIKKSAIVNVKKLFRVRPKLTNELKFVELTNKHCVKQWGKRR
jgi:hypothetical protein